jgi:hypothetical protein
MLDILIVMPESGRWYRGVAFLVGSKSQFASLVRACTDAAPPSLSVSGNSASLSDEFWYQSYPCRQSALKHPRVKSRSIQLRDTCECPFPACVVPCEGAARVQVRLCLHDRLGVHFLSGQRLRHVPAQRLCPTAHGFRLLCSSHMLVC